MTKWQTQSLEIVSIKMHSSQCTNTICKGLNMAIFFKFVWSCSCQQNCMAILYSLAVTRISVLTGLSKESILVLAIYYAVLKYEVLSYST